MTDGAAQRRRYAVEDEQRADAAGEPTMAKRVGQPAIAIPGSERIETVLEPGEGNAEERRCAGEAGPACGQQGRQRERDEQREQRRHDDDDAELFHELADDSREERDGQEHDDVDERNGNCRTADFAAAANRGIAWRFAHVAVTRIVLPGDDRVVDEDTDRQRQAHERYDVERGTRRRASQRRSPAATTESRP